MSFCRCWEVGEGAEELMKVSFNLWFLRDNECHGASGIWKEHFGEKAEVLLLCMVSAAGQVLAASRWFASTAWTLQPAGAAQAALRFGKSAFRQLSETSHIIPFLQLHFQATARSN